MILRCWRISKYVSRNNPQLAQFLVQHPEIARNPEYYLFTHVDIRGGRRDQALERAVWPELSQPRQTEWIDIVGPISAAVAFACFLGAIAVVDSRSFIENRRWSRIFKLQSDVHGRLIEKFSSTQEIAAYMGTEAGRRFLEAAPIPVGFEPEQRMPNAVARVLWPLQVGVVLVLLGRAALPAPCRTGNEYSHAGAGNRGADARNWIYPVRRDYVGSGRASRADSRKLRRRQTALSRSITRRTGSEPERIRLWPRGA